MRPTLALGVLLLLARPAPGLAQGAAPGPAIAFPQVTGIPTPLQSISGRFSSLNPLNPHRCAYRKVSGRVVSSHLILVKEMDCGRSGHDNALVNVQFSNPADAAQMVTGRNIVIAASFKRAEEDREPTIVAEFLIAEKARIEAADPIDGSTRPDQAFTSYMICQPPELDALAGQLGSELCVQSTIVASLAAAGPALERAARTPSNASPEDTVSGDPHDISCRRDPKLSDQHLAAIACARGSYWAWYKALHDPQFSMPAPA
ncbi:MAG: hypothetical protein H0U98_09270 [Alphaproteobacteria bacterium]|nr:hypothetical protein [Alphaproteobacteria bacterium]